MKRSTNNLFTKVIVAASLLIGSSVIIFAADKTEANVDAFDNAAMDAVRAKIEENLSGLPVDEISTTPLGNWFEILSRGEIYYVTRDANYLFTGQLIEIKNGMVNLTAASKRKHDQKLSPMRKKIVSTIKDEDTILFKADNEKHRIDVFVDVTCGYCRKLHLEVPMLNSLGVTVRYLAYPRAGLASSASKTLESVWCSDDRIGAITAAFDNRAVEPKTCKNPISKQYGLVKKFALTGTPNIIFTNGDLWPGYLKATDVMTELNKRGL